MLGAAPRAELAWLAAHGTLLQLDTGDVLSAKGAPRRGDAHRPLRSRRHLRGARGAGLRKMREWRAGEVAGLLPYSRLGVPPGDAVAQEPTLILSVPRERLRDLARECHEVTALLVHEMLDRARDFTAKDLHDDKLMSLGRLSAGLAHELNNPAAALERSASLLEDRLDDAEIATRALGAARLSDAQLAAVDADPHRLPRVESCRACVRQSSRPSARTRSATGSRITAWTATWRRCSPTRP